MAGGQIKSDDAQALGIDRTLELGPVVGGKAVVTVDGFHQKHVTLAGILEQAQQLRPIRCCADGVLQVFAGNDLVMVAGELLQGGPGARARRDQESTLG